jgi:hypothetical protein
VIDASSDAEALAATSQLEALEVSILELEEKKKQVLALLARKVVAVLVSARSEAADGDGADAMDVDNGAAAASDEASPADEAPFAAADEAVTTGAGPPSRTTFDKLVAEATVNYRPWPSAPRPYQEAVLRAEEGFDCVAILTTGAGKTLCFALPAQRTTLVAPTPSSASIGAAITADSPKSKAPLPRRRARPNCTPVLHTPRTARNDAGSHQRDRAGKRPAARNRRKSHRCWARPAALAKKSQEKRLVKI